MTRRQIHHRRPHRQIHLRVAVKERTPSRLGRLAAAARVSYAFHAKMNYKV